jgi:acyl dehydratase
MTETTAARVDGPDAGVAAEANTVDLADVPATGAVYRRAIRTMFHRYPDATALPTTSYAVADVAVDLGRLAAYNRVCGFRLTDELPATYPHVLAFPLAMHLMTASDFPFRVIGLVHVANRIRQTRPIRIDERVRLAVHGRDLRKHDRGRQFDVVSTATVDGVEVWRGVSTYVRRSGKGAARTTPDESETPSARWTVDRDITRAYARVSGDRNPIHTSRVGARLFGFRRPIAHGMWSTARCLAAFEGRLPDAYAVDVAFKRPILLPSIVTFAEHPDRQFSVTDASGMPHVRGSITAI